MRDLNTEWDCMLKKLTFECFVLLFKGLPGKLAQQTKQISNFHQYNANTRLNTEMKSTRLGEVMIEISIERENVTERMF